MLVGKSEDLDESTSYRLTNPSKTKKKVLLPISLPTNLTALTIVKTYQLGGRECQTTSEMNVEGHSSAVFKFYLREVIYLNATFAAEGGLVEPELG